MKNLIVDSDRAETLKELTLTVPSVSLNARQLCDFEMLANGTFAPLKGFMAQADYEATLDRMRLQSGDFWPLPICLDIPASIADTLETEQSIALRDPEGFMLAVMHISDKWRIDKKREATALFGSSDADRSDVDFFYRNTSDYYLGGAIEAISLPLHYNFQQNRLTADEVRALYRKLGWQRILGYQTRHPIHRAQYEMINRAMRDANANLLLLAVTGAVRLDDFDHYTRVRCYKAVKPHFPPDSTMFSLLQYTPRMAGIREALLKTMISKNYGCTHSLIGPEYVRVPDHNGHQGFSEDESAKAMLLEVADEIGIELLLMDPMTYLPFEDEFRPLKEVPADTQTKTFSHDELRNRVRRGRRIPDWVTFPEVIEELRKSFPPPKDQGFALFLTGLSGAGKSTIARILYSRLLEIGTRPVTLLDGDIVRHNLSSELNFSKEHRDINVRRIGFVASEITKNRGVAICAPIAPYRETRRQIRQTIETHGGFVEVHVATPIAVCEQRDRKGMYAKARAGIIKGFTGVDDPYEEPNAPEVRIDTTALSPDESAQQILLHLGQEGYL